MIVNTIDTVRILDLKQSDMTITGIITQTTGGEIKDSHFKRECTQEFDRADIVFFGKRCLKRKY